MSSPSTGSPASLVELTDAQLIDLLPTEKIYKDRGKPVQINRTPQERAVIAELWRRYQIHRIQKETAENIAFLCPTKRVTVQAFQAWVLKITRNEFRRLLVRGKVKNVLAWGTVREKRNARDLHRRLTGVRPPARGAQPAPDRDIQEPDRKIVEEVELGQTEAKISDTKPLAIYQMVQAEREKMVHEILEEHSEEHPESRKAIDGRHVERLTPEQLAEHVFPSHIFSETLEEKLKKIDEMIEHDRKDAAMRLWNKCGLTAPILLSE
jgi:hypothetical protein